MKYLHLRLGREFALIYLLPLRQIKNFRNVIILRNKNTIYKFNFLRFHSYLRKGRNCLRFPEKIQLLIPIKQEQLPQLPYQQKKFSNDLQINIKNKTIFLKEFHSHLLVYQMI